MNKFIIFWRFKFILLFALLFCVTSCELFTFNYFHEVKGMKHYSRALSDFSLCRYLTFPIDEQNRDPLIEEIRFDNSYLRFKSVCKNHIWTETVFIRLNYSSFDFNFALNYIRTQPGYNDVLICNYNSYSFAINLSEKIKRNNDCNTNYNFDLDDSFINWINIFGISSINNSIILIGFYYKNSSKNALNQYYGFSNWESLFDTYFSVDSWDKDIIVQRH